MTLKGLILGLGNLSIGRPYIQTIISRGCSSITESSRAYPLPTLWHTHTKPETAFHCTQGAKALELSLSATFAEPPTNIYIKTPGFNSTNIIIGHIPAKNITAILDPSASASLIGDVVPDSSEVIGDNPHTLNRQPEYKARHIQKIRRWKMNRHKLIKRRKRDKTKILKRSAEKTKKKIMQNTAICKAIRQDGEQFDALEFVKERLALAKSGGYVQDIWKSPDEQPEVPWVPYTPPPREIEKYHTKVQPPYFPTQDEIRERRKERKRKKQQQS